jgi:hypothetical protein
MLREIGKIDSRLSFRSKKANLLGDHARAVTLTMAFLADNSEVRYRSCIADALVHELEEVMLIIFHFLISHNIKAIQLLFCSFMTHLRQILMNSVGFSAFSHSNNL